MVLTVFLSFRGSLKRWADQGILSREIALYFELIRIGTFNRVQIFSYDGGDRNFVRSLCQHDSRYQGISLITPHHSASRGMIGNFIWSIFGPVTHRAAIKQSLALRTNQISGSWAALIARIVTARPLVVRAGYLLSRRFRKNRQFVRAALAKIVEIFVFGIAKRIIVTSKFAADSLAPGGNKSKVSLLPSYVDTTLFKPKLDYDFDQPLVTTTRLVPQKNLTNLIHASAKLHVRLLIYGAGPQRMKLEKLAQKLNAPVTMAGLLPNDAVARELQNHSIFLLPSLHEGLPKALLEAMACGLICIGSKIPGITDVIEDGKNGYLIKGFEAHGIAEAIQHALKLRDPDIGMTARKTIEKNFGLAQYARKETAIYAELT